jgi:hypothetical protein
MKTIKDIAQDMYPVEEKAECYTAFLEGAEHMSKYACEHECIPSSPMTIEQKQEWLKTRKPLTIVASESRFGYYVFRAYPYTPEDVAKNPDLDYAQKANADDAVFELIHELQNEVDDYYADLEQEEQEE